MENGIMSWLFQIFLSASVPEGSGTTSSPSSRIRRSFHLPAVGISKSKSDAIDEQYDEMCRKPKNGKGFDVKSGK
jgi:hypothetical protein